MAEYLANVHPVPFDGILFRSTQRENGRNVVLFPEKEKVMQPISEQFPVKYIDGSAKVFETEAITYRHFPKGVLSPQVDYGSLQLKVEIPDF
ncbi:MAG: hypothetical protein Q7T66_07150 [Herminiimonas sp.]|uniref:hypothetical protein n=1 Tax=Herminiimonas sp. TaxID=1926289 RepID=UPI002722A3B9|nr:hypothetical protein [Herminiimonas sp.]MDO9420420.1 hypothetical protein [Herminiimonas sp.]